MRMSNETNIERIKRIMNYSRCGALMQGFVMEAIPYYAQKVLNCFRDNPDFMQNHFINRDAWKDCAEEICDEFNVSILQEDQRSVQETDPLTTFTPVKVPAPKHKKNWPGQKLLLTESFPYGGVELPLAQVVTIERRENAKQTMHRCKDVSGLGGIRVLKVNWQCPTCNNWHYGYIPEAWIEEERAFFVEKNQ